MNLRPRIGRLLANWGSKHQRLYRFAGAALALPIAVWFIGWLLVGDEIILVRWGAYIAPWLAVGALAAACLLIAGRRVWWAAGALAVAILILAPVLDRFNPARWIGAPKREDLRVMTFNASTSNGDLDSVARLITRERPDIAFLQQVQNLPVLLRDIRRQPDHLQYFEFPEQTADTVILSRFPLSETQLLIGRTTAIAAIGACEIRLWSLHAPHGQFSVAPQGTFFANTAASLRDERMPVLAGGDLNSTEFNSVQAPLRGQVRDAFAETGAGLGLTFPSHVRRFGILGTLFRIDHIFFRKQKPTFSWVAGDSAGSDHYAVVATFDRSPKC